MDVLGNLVGIAIALLGAGVLAGGAYSTAVRLYPDGPSSARLSAATVLAGGALVALFELLTSLHAFRRDVAPGLAAIGGAGLVLWVRPGLREAVLQRLRADARCALDVLGRDRWVAPAALLTAAVAGIRLLRGLAAPPLAYDALTYHLARAATWIRTGAQDRFLAPDAWGYCTFYPSAGDALWAWAMLPTSSDLLLAPAGAVAWLAVVLGAYAAARSLSASRRASALSALAVGAAPCVMPHLAASYVDLPALAGLLHGFALSARHAREGRRADAVLAAVALAVAAAARSSALPFLAFGLLLAALVEARRDAPARQRARTFAACLAAALLAAPTYLGTFADTGSPVYPMAVRVAGVEVFPGSEEFRWVHSGEALGATRQPAATIARSLFVPDPSAESPHLNLGPVAPLLLLLGAIGAARLLRRGPRAPVALALAILATVAAGTFLWEGSSGFLAVPWWLDKIGRFLMPGLAVAIVLGAAQGGRLADVVRIAAVAAGLVLAFPLGWSRADAIATIEVAGVLAAGGGLAWGASRLLAGRGRHRVAVGAAVVAGIAALAAVPSIRAGARYPAWQAAADGEAYDLHPANRLALSAWPVWQALDGEAPVRIALAAGFDGVGHNWYTYPLFGSRLQNDVEYVPVTRDGRVMDYAAPDALAPRLDRAAWLQRLADRRIEVLVILQPPPPEAAWAAQLPDVFAPTASSPGAQAYRVDAAALAGRLAAPPPAP